MPVVTVLAALVPLLLLPSCGRDSAPSAPRLILLYIPCSVSAEFLSPYRSDGSTPNLEAFAGEGLVFERHQTEAGYSGVAYASILTGRQADRHGVFTHPTPLGEDNRLVSEVFSDLGFETWFFGAQQMADQRLGYAQGVAPERRFRAPLKAEDPNFRRLLERLQAEPELRALVVTAFTVSHSPYHPGRVETLCASEPHHCAPLAYGGESAEERVRRVYFERYLPSWSALSLDYANTVRELSLGPDETAEMTRAIDLVYRSMVHHLDELFGEVLGAIDAAGLGGQALVVFTADHGETMNRDHTLFKWSHGWELAPEVLRVPLILRGPGIEPGRFSGVTRSIDLLPTLVALAGESLDPKTREEIDGDDLSSAIRGDGGRTGRVAFSHTPVLDPRFRSLIAESELWRRFHTDAGVAQLWVSARQGDRVFKYRNLDGTRWGFQVFDLAEDPQERHDLFDADDPIHRDMADRLTRYRERLLSVWSNEAPAPLLDERSLRDLRSLGYIE